MVSPWQTQTNRLPRSLRSSLVARVYQGHQPLRNFTEHTRHLVVGGNTASMSSHPTRLAWRLWSYARYELNRFCLGDHHGWAIKQGENCSLCAISCNRDASWWESCCVGKSGFPNLPDHWFFSIHSELFLPFFWVPLNVSLLATILFRCY